MPALARGQENTPSTINWFITVNGVLTDAYEVGFQIWDITGGLPGSVVFPVAGDPNSWEDVTNAPGKFGTGSYYAYDNTLNQGYTPPISEPIGTHRIKWRWKITQSAPYQEGQEDFEVLVQSSGTTADEYCTVQEIRDQGVPAEADGGPSDQAILDLIRLYSRAVDRFTRCFFNARSLTLKLDGSGHETLFLPFPIIEITSLKINGSDSALDPSCYTVYNRDLIEDKRSPRIKLNGASSIFQAGNGIFELGEQNQEVTGMFGWIENGETPIAIKRAVEILVIRNLGNLADGQGGPSTWGGGSATTPTGVLSERTDKHAITYANPLSGLGDPLLRQLINDPQALGLISPYVCVTPQIAWSSPNYERGLL